jgi:hypothetical protein
LGRVTLREYNIRATTPISIKIVKIWIASFACQNTCSSIQ